MGKGVNGTHQQCFIFEKLKDLSCEVVFAMVVIWTSSFTTCAFTCSNHCR